MALVAALIVIYRAPEVHGAVRALTHARFTLASPDRSGEAAAALHVIERHPVAGVGPGHGTLRWIGPGDGLRVHRFDHDGYLQVLTDLGVIGAVLAAAFLAAVGQLLWRARPDLPGRPPGRAPRPRPPPSSCTVPSTSSGRCQQFPSP